jgi:hypothetical protein
MEGMGGYHTRLCFGEVQIFVFFGPNETYVKFEVLTAVVMSVAILCDIAPCGVCEPTSFRHGSDRLRRNVD